MTSYSIPLAFAFAVFCTALCVGAVRTGAAGNESVQRREAEEQWASVRAELDAAGMDVDQVYEHCTSSTFGWCMRPEYATGGAP